MTDLPKRMLPNGYITDDGHFQYRCAIIPIENDDDWPTDLIDRLDAWTARKLREQLLEEGKKNRGDRQF